MNWKFWQKKRDWIVSVDFTRHMQKLELKDGDIVVLKTSLPLSQNMIAKISDSFKDIIKKRELYNCDIIVLEAGLEIGILRKGENYEETGS